ncbi:hypothetical protein OG555_36470 [Kribbella sp. NBC_01484]|nr:hypothetical protein [Kribbella sp. NBC_01484]
MSAADAIPLGTLLIAPGSPAITSARRFRPSGRIDRSHRSSGRAVTR